MFRPLAPCCLALSLLMAQGAVRGEPPAPLPSEARAARWCEELGRQLYSVSADACLGLDFRPGAMRSVEGRSLMRVDRLPHQARQTASNRPGSRAPRVMMIGGIHGDELTSVSIVFKWLERLAADDGPDIHWRVIPLANPDGLLASPAQRMNARGVDLNRNFDTPDWQTKAMDYWVGRTRRDPRRFPGDAAVSEPETRWLQDEIQDFVPDVIVSIHAPYGVLDFDGPAEEPKRFGRLRLNRLGVYPGSLGNYGGVFKGVPVITIELPHATRMPSAREQEAIWHDMLKWIGQNFVPGNLS
ncbi:MAG: succinylglutamate desuccinylase/aspartoacylase family protein [Rhodocyclaceae bacterium]|nr:succinylglutamate desuccinylase/aspartoacylase family protein [Rhodocyclaceae bacterium]